jgi:outer membrane lipoprotein carrier protein
MKRLTIVGFLCLLVLNSYSQTDPKAQEILKGVSAKYKSYKSLTASFKLNLLDKKTNKAQNQSGTVTLKGSMYHLAMADQEVMSDGKVMWTFLKESNEVQISEVEEKSDGLSPTTIFTMYEKGFKTKYKGDKTENGNMMQQIELFPEDNKKNYIKILISINKKDKYVNSATVYDKNGNIYTYSITKFTPNAAVNDDMFTFNKAKYPGVEIVDLR